MDNFAPREGNRRAGSPVNKNHKLAAGVTFVPALGVTSRCQRSWDCHVVALVTKESRWKRRLKRVGMEGTQKMQGWATKTQAPYTCRLECGGCRAKAALRRLVIAFP